MSKCVQARDAYLILKSGTILAVNALIDSASITGVVSVTQNTFTIGKSMFFGAVGASVGKCKFIISGTRIALDVILIITVDALSLGVEDVTQITLTALLGAKTGTV